MQKFQVKQYDYDKIYEVISQLGVGGYGQIFLAVDRNTRKRVAIKRYGPTPKGGLDPSVLREIIFSQMNSPYIKHLECIGIGEGGVWVAFECLETDLLDYMNKFRTMSLQTVKLILWQILSGLAVMHEKGLIHRDIKPENVFLSGEEFPSVKLGDLGHTRSVARMDWARFQYSDSIGTILYKAPEQFLACRTTTATDIYAAGLIMAELILGRRARQSQNGVYIVLHSMTLVGLCCDDPSVKAIVPEEWHKPLSEFELDSEAVTSGVLNDIIKQRAVTEYDLLGFDLLQKLLSFDDAKRPGAQEALHHSFFKDLDYSVFPAMR